LYLGSFEQHIPHLLACGVSQFLHLAHITCAAGLLFWPVEVIKVVGFFTMREFHKLWPTARSGDSRPTGCNHLPINLIVG